MNCPDCNKPLDMGLSGYYPCRCKEQLDAKEPVVGVDVAQPGAKRSFVGIFGDVGHLEITSVDTSIGKIEFTQPVVLLPGDTLAISYSMSPTFYRGLYPEARRENQ